MRPTVVLLSFAVGLVSAVPSPQNINFAAVLALPTQVQGPALTVTKQIPTYNPSAAASKAAADVIAHGLNGASTHTGLSKRAVASSAVCIPQLRGSGPLTIPDTDIAFLGNANYSILANSAATPQGYVKAFTNLQGSVEQNGYMGVLTMQSYSTILCQQACDNAAGCIAFNLFLERYPVVDPTANKCANPASTAMIKCTLWGLPISGSTATNVGQYRGSADKKGQSFHVVIAGSNGYVKNASPTSQQNFTGPAQLPGAIQAPLYNNQDTYLGFQMYAGTYNPSQCAAACQAITKSDRAAAIKAGKTTYSPCNFFNSYVLALNNSPKGTYCTFYTHVWDRTYATNLGQYDNQGNWYTVSSSYGFALTKLDSGKI